MTFPLWLAAAAGLLALAALVRARRTARALERLAESYWELRYEHGQLRARLARLEGGEPADAGSALPDRADTATREQGSFVPLSSLKR